MNQKSVEAQQNTTGLESEERLEFCFSDLLGNFDKFLK